MLCGGITRVWVGGRIRMQVVRHDRLLLGLLETDSGLRDDHEGTKQRLPSRVLRLPALQSEVGKCRS